MTYYWLTVVLRVVRRNTSIYQMEHVIELNEGARTFKTWIRTKAGVRAAYYLSDSFVKRVRIYIILKMI